MANPPFNLKDWRGENELLDDPRWMGYEVPLKSNANYGWILNMVSKLSDNGIAGFILANGALSGGGDEYKIRRKLIENDAFKVQSETDLKKVLYAMNQRYYYADIYEENRVASAVRVVTN